MGIPLMSGFASKWMLYAAALQAGWAVPAMVAWAASLGTVFLGAKATNAVFLGPTTENTNDAHESPPTMLLGMGFLAAGSVVLGVAPQLAVNYFLNPILAALGMGAGVHVTWLGLSADAGSFSSTGGLVLALVSLVLGGAIYLVAYAVRPASAGPAMAGAGGGVFTGGEPLGEQGRLTAGDFSEIFQEHWRSFFRWTNVDRVYLGLWSGLQAVSRELGVVVSWMERRATLLLVVFAAAIFALVRWIVPGASGGLEGGAAQAPVLLVAAVGVAAAALFFASIGKSTVRIPLWPCVLIVGGLAVAGLVAPNSWLRLGLLEAAALLTVVLVWLTARSQAAKVTYLAVVLISAASMIASDFFAERGALDWSRALLLTGIAAKFAVVPLFFWLLALADELPALVLGLIIGVLDMAAFGEFLMGAERIPTMLTPQPLFFYAATLTSLLAALLMLTQRSLKRLLVLSTVEDVGFLLLGAASAGMIGQNGAIVAASTHALAKALLFISLAAPEADGALSTEPVALAVRYPVSAFGFLFGMLAMLGIPPTLGFIGRWRLYAVAFQIGLCPLTIFIVSSILALIAYTLALTRNWWGPPGDTSPPATKEPFVLKATIVVLVVLLLAAGIWPNAWQILMGVRP
jgi:formate hydrogenlyase subunit 3/multisubunit Na+/H+ antiporter MnhD subunit